MQANFKASSVLRVLLIAILVSVMGFSTARAGVFTVQSVTDGGGATPDIMVLADGSGNTITVTSTETDTDCFNITNAGRITMFAGNSAGCFNDSAVPLIFTTNGFELGRVDFADIDDMDGFSSRDSFAASVAGTWTSSQLDVNPIVGALPPWLPATQDQRGRLSAAGGVGNFLARANGNDPLNDSATFVLDTPTTSFIIYMDDVQGSRNARMFFDLAPLTVDVAPTLTLNKTVINDDGGTETAGAWTLTATGPATLSGTTGVSGVVAIGTYTLTETGPSDYTQTGLSCSGAADTDLSDGLTLADAEVVTCTFTNDDDTPANPTLTLLKTVVNDDTGTAVAGDWTLTATGPTTLSGTTGVNGTVSPGTYTLSESGPAGYTQTSLTCSGAADTNLADGLTLATGETVSCTFTNDDVLSSPGLLIALADTPTAQNGFTGGTTPESVLDNDTLNGVAVVPTDVTLTPGTAPSPADGSISMNADGSITVAAGTTAGAYSYDYTICEVLNPTNCSGATATVNVAAATIAALADTPTAQNGFTGGTTPESVLDNDTLNGVAVVPTDVTLTPGTAPSPADGSISMNADGSITVAAGTTAGAYSYDYTICEVLNPTNCSGATATVNVAAATIAALADTPTAQNGFTGGTTPESVLDNDTLNGVAVVPTDVTLTPGTAPSPADGSISMNADGSITVAAGTTAGAYSYDYTICEVLNPTNCSGATATVNVAAATIAALADTPTAQNGFTGGTTPESVLDNDTLNGVAVVPTDVTLTPGTAPSPADGSISMNADGSITVAAGTTAGAYSYDYTICEVLNPTNCSGATATVNVDVSPLNQIESVLTTILSEDLAQTISRQSLTFSGLAGDALDRLMNENGRRCAANVRNLLAQSDINFATGSTEILQSSIPLLDEIAIALASCPDTQFEIAGHTDSRGSDEYNRSLSQGRVETVRAELARRGVPATRLIGVGYGENRPKAENSTPEGLAANRRVEFISLDRFDPSNMATQKCGTIRAFDIDGSLEVGEAGLNSTGTFGEESFDCNTLVRRITKGEFTLTDDDNLGTQGFLSFNIAHEKQFGTSRLNGVFWGGYLSQTDVDTATTGTINGIGINAGLYGARAHDNGLYSNFYAAGGLGLHTFDLNTALSITSEGEYAYLGLFAGAGLSGEIERGDLIIRPKIGFDLGAGFADDAEVTASGLGAIQTGLLELDTAFGVRGYLEASFLTETEGNSNVAGLSRLIALTPSLFCDTGFGTSDPECGLGGNIEYTLNDAASEIDWRVNLGAEVTSSTRSLSIGISRERAVFGDLGTISTLLSGDESGAQVSHSLNLEW